MRFSVSAWAAVMMLLFGSFCAAQDGVAIDLDFETDPEALGVEFFGVAEWRDEGGNPDGYLSVTDAANGQRGAIVFPDLLDGGDYAGVVSISADLRVGGGTERPADGFSFNLVRPDDPLLEDGEGYAASPTGEANLPEEGSTTGLGIGFDEWFSGGDDVIGMSIRIDDELVDQFEFPVLNGALDDQESLQTGEDLQTFIEDVEAGDTDLGWARLTIDLDADNTLLVTYKDVEVFNQQIDYERGPGQLVFGGRTGGANANHHIDNISIRVGPTIIEDPCDFDGDGSLGLGDLDMLSAASASGANEAKFDLNDDGSVNAADIKAFVTGSDKLGTWIGDANLDGEFGSGDLVTVFGEGKFETGQAATWGQGDWNGDGVFGSGDLVAAFQDGGFEKGQRVAAAVPEPSSLVLLLLGAFAIVSRRRR